jgi:hypothetical protein
MTERQFTQLLQVLLDAARLHRIDPAIILMDVTAQSIAPCSENSTDGIARAHGHLMDAKKDYKKFWKTEWSGNRK